jgi:hypothetical protein
VFLYVAIIVNILNNNRQPTKGGPPLWGLGNGIWQVSDGSFQIAHLNDDGCECGLHLSGSCLRAQ